MKKRLRHGGRAANRGSRCACSVSAEWEKTHDYVVVPYAVKNGRRWITRHRVELIMADERGGFLSAESQAGMRGGHRRCLRRGRVGDSEALADFLAGEVPSFQDRFCLTPKRKLLAPGTQDSLLGKPSPKTRAYMTRGVLEAKKTREPRSIVGTRVPRGPGG